MRPYEFLELLAAEYKSSDIELLSDQIKNMVEKGLISKEEKDEHLDYLDEFYYEEDWEEAETKTDYIKVLDKSIWGLS